MGVLQRVRDFEKATKDALKMPAGGPGAGQTSAFEVEPETLAVLADADAGDTPHHLGVHVSFSYGFGPGEGAAAARFYRKLIATADQLWLQANPDSMGFQGSGVDDAILGVFTDGEAIGEIDLESEEGKRWLAAIIDLG